MKSINLSQIMKEHNLELSQLVGDLDFCIVPQISGIAVMFRGIRFVDKSLHRHENLKTVLRKGPWGFCSNEVIFSPSLLRRIQEAKSKEKQLTIDDALEILQYLQALDDLIHVCKGKELVDVITEKKFVFPKNVVVDV